MLRECATTNGRENPMTEGKHCRFCDQTKPESAFSPNVNSADGLRSQCKDCTNAAGRRRYEQNVQDLAKREQIQATRVAKYHARTPEQNKRYRKRSHIGRYGYTTKTFAAHLQRIDNRCEICGCSLEGHGDRHIHHDHTGTRKDVRGIVCSACNYNLGYLSTIGRGDEMKALGLFLA
jgi:alpha-D-ribose 1-methylphosphonate 5-phosphate C-P lyase